MPDRYEPLPHMVAALSEHVLTFRDFGEGRVELDLRRPGTSALSITLHGHPGGMFLEGDLVLGPHRTGIGSRKPWRWFVFNDLDPAYLCEKWFTRDFYAEHALADAKQWRDEAKTEGDTAKAREWRDLARDLTDRTDHEAMGIVLQLQYRELLQGTEGFGMGYPPTDARWLVAVHRRIREIVGDTLPEAMARRFTPIDPKKVALNSALTRAAMSRMPDLAFLDRGNHAPLPQDTLSAWLEAGEHVRLTGGERRPDGTTVLHTVCEKRLLAALWVLHQYEPSDDPILYDREMDVALAVVVPR